MIVLPHDVVAVFPVRNTIAQEWTTIDYHARRQLHIHLKGRKAKIVIYYLDTQGVHAAWLIQTRRGEFPGSGHRRSR